MEGMTHAGGRTDHGRLQQLVLRRDAQLGRGAGPDQRAEKALNIARANAPVDTGAYRDGLQVEAVQHAHRTTYRVVGTDAKTMLIESQTGNLVKALKKAKS